MRQRVMIAMALACEPDILIADEPTTALDVTIQAQILELIESLQDQLDMAVIMITHNLGVIASMCDRMIVMYAGQVCERGTTDDVFYNPRHEYTRGLLRSLPTLEKTNDKLIPIPGQPVDVLNIPPGCPFAPRCGKTMVICQEQLCPDEELNPGHFATCWMNTRRELIAEGVELDG